MSGDFEPLIFGLLGAVALSGPGFLAWRHFGWALQRSAVSLALRPTERMSSNQLSGYLLSGHLAVLALDNFNQLASARPPRHVRRLLKRRWGLNSAIDCRRRIEQRLGRLDGLLPDAQAWEIQQLACITRLSFAVGYVSREMAESTLARLQFAARSHHETWADYLRASLAAARRAGMALDTVEWKRFERSHDLLLNAPESPARRVGLSGRAQGRPPVPTTAIPTT